MFIYISAGELFVNGQRLRQEDHARLDLERTPHGNNFRFSCRIRPDRYTCKHWKYNKAKEKRQLNEP
ncbi:MAG: hypothetical protein WB014_13460 [Methanosarcina sp.]